MNRERWIGLAVILLIVGGFLVLRNKDTKKIAEKPADGEGVEIEERASEFAKQMGISLPDDVQRANLKDVTGGVGTGLATRKYANGQFAHTVLTGLPDPEQGSWYEAWLVRGEPFDQIHTGRLRMAKGGWILDEFTSSQDLTDHNKVVVTREKVDDRKPETTVLEGSF